MAEKPAPLPPAQAIAEALDHMKAARALLRRAGAGRAAGAQAAAIKSAEGAARHAAHAEGRPDMKRKGPARRAARAAALQAEG